jgi:hypothetical protein
MKDLRRAAVVLLCLCLSAPGFTQTSNATVGGTVSDASGALIPGVTITATNVGTGIVNTAVTNEAGTYTFASLQTGTYTISRHSAVAEWFLRRQSPMAGCRRFFARLVAVADGAE